MASVVMSACLNPVEDQPIAPRDPSVEVSDAGPAPVDAGSSDAGSYDAGPSDAGIADAGVPDAGRAFDAGQCTNLPIVPLSEFASSPRTDKWLELLVLHADPSRFSVDEPTYARAVREKAVIDASDAGPFSFIPNWGGSIGLKLDPVGTRQLRAGAYTEWDCLNWTYRATPMQFSTSGTDGYLFVSVEPIISLPRLEAEYAALPHVEFAFQNSAGICASCGCASDGCLAIEGSTWWWVWYVQSRTCANEWHRMRTEEDGGMSFETWADAGLAPPWFDEVPSCWDQLWATQFRPRDGGP